jgi:hypothetical protein
LNPAYVGWKRRTGHHFKKTGDRKMTTSLMEPAGLSKIYGHGGEEVPIENGQISVDDADVAGYLDQGCTRVPGD